METIEMLGIALGLATLAGINLYLTVFVTGLAVHFQWVTLPAEHAGLNVLGDPWIMTIAGILYFLEFFADKVPWVDSLNDAVHTAIRPLGGAVLAVLALGEANPVISVIAALVGGGAALTSHAAKSATRLVTNASPEPVSNVSLSLAEDAAVLGGLTLIALSPIIAGLVAILLLIAAWLFLPRLTRAMRITAWLAWRKLNSPSSPPVSKKLPLSCEVALRRARATKADIAEALHCASGGGPRLPKNHLGWLVRFEADPARCFFVAPRLLRGPVVIEIPLASVTTERKTKFLSEILSFRQPSGDKYTFLFERGHGLLADSLAETAKRAPSSQGPETSQASSANKSEAALV